MNVYRMLIVVGIILIQTGGANAQFGGLGNLIKKGLNKPANQPATDQSQPTTPATGDVKASTSGLPPIFEAAKNCDDAKFAELFKKDISTVNKTLYDMNWGRDGDDLTATDKFMNSISSYTLLDFAAANGCTNIIQQLLDMDVNVNPSEHPSPISLAAGNGHLDVVKMLLKAKADSKDAMDAAVENGQVEVLKTLVDAGANGDRMLLDESVTKGQLEIVRILLKLKDPMENFSSDENLYEYGYKRRGAFPDAIKTGSLDIVKAFVASGEDVSDSRDEAKFKEDTLFQIAIDANQPEILAYLKEARKAQAVELAEKKAAIANEAAAKQEKENQENAKEKNERNAAMQKQVLASLDQPALDLFGMANSRYRKFNGTVYDCAEPIEFLNHLYSFIPVESQYNDNPSSYTELKGRIEAEDKSLQENPWYNIRNDCSLVPAQVTAVTPDGLIVRLNSQQDVELLVLLKNHPKQKTAVDGDLIIGQLFVLKTSPYQYTDALGVTRTIPSYDMGVVVPTPSGSVPKLPLPATGN